MDLATFFAGDAEYTKALTRILGKMCAEKALAQAMRETCQRLEDALEKHRRSEKSERENKVLTGTKTPSTL